MSHPTVPATEAQGPPAPSFEEVVKDAIRDPVAWRRLVKNADDAQRAIVVLRRWKRDLASQRRVRAAEVQSGAVPGRHFAAWLEKSARFERSIDHRLQEAVDLRNMQAPGSDLQLAPKTSNVTRVKRQNAELREVIRNLGLGLRHVGSPEDASDLMNSTLINFGKLGVHTLADALAKDLLTPSSLSEDRLTPPDEETR